MFIKLLLCLVVSIAVAEATIGISLEDVSKAERAEIINEAIAEAKVKAEVQAQAQEADKKKKTPVTADALLNRGFKKPTKMAIQQGRARLMLEDMVHRAERKLIEKRKESEAKTASLETKAAHLAEELYHTPGSLLHADEIAKMYQETEGCDDIRTEQTCPTEAQDPTINQFRRIDGTCNNLYNSTAGASDTAFRRILDSLVYEDGVESLRGENQAADPELRFSAPVPSARRISKNVVRDKIDFEFDFTHLLMQFGQFLDHDLDLGPEFEVTCPSECERNEFCVPIRVEKDDETFGVNTPRNGDCLLFRRSIPTCQPRKTASTFAAREQINVLTSFIDGSMIYGSNDEQAAAVRDTGNAGLLKVRGAAGDVFEALPIDEFDEEAGEEPHVACLNAEDCFLCGDVRCNEQVSLTIMHTIWVRFHNGLARRLALINPQWDDERLYQETRKIVSSVVQKIVYYDYLPKIMGDAYDITIGRYRRYNKNVDPAVPNAFATAAYRYGHSLVRPEFSRLKPDYTPANDPLNLVEMFFNPELYEQTNEGNDVVRGWVSEPARRADEFVNGLLTNSLFQTPRETLGTGMDLGALNIQRGRDHGLPVYGRWRDFCAREFPELGVGTLENWLTYVRFRELHGFVVDADLWVAGLSEVRVNDALIGPTFSCIFGITFRDVRDGDRFYFESQASDGPDSISVFTRSQLQQIRDTTFSRVICSTTDTTRIQQDAFLVGGNKRNCQGNTNRIIQRLNLFPWLERNGQFVETCFIPVLNKQQRIIRTRTREIGTGFGGVVDDHLPEFNEVLNLDDDSVNNDFQCLPILCPRPNQRNFFVAFTLRENRFQIRCPVTPLLDNLQNDPGAGNANVRFLHRLIRSDIGNGIFATVNDCQRQNKATIEFDCPPIFASTSANSGEDFEDTFEDLPDYVNDLKEDTQADMQEDALSKGHSKAAAANNGGNDRKYSMMNEDNHVLQEELEELMEKLSN